MESLALLDDALDKCSRLQGDLARVRADVDRSKFYTRTRTPAQLDAERQGLAMLTCVLTRADQAAGAGWGRSEPQQ